MIKQSGPAEHKIAVQTGKLEIRNEAIRVTKHISLPVKKRFRNHSST